jgi:hypothetical protein
MASPDVVQKAYSVLHDIRRRDEYGAGYDFETLGEFFDSEEHEKNWIIKGVVAWGETTAWIGPPGSLKSALMSDLAISVAYNRNWHGRKYRSYGEGVGVLYFALERADLVKRRLEAQAKSLGLDLEKGSTIVVVPGIIDLATPESVKKAATTLNNVESFTGDMIGLVIFDTHAKLIAAAGGDEDKAKDQGRLFAGIERFKEMTGRPHVALVGHTGKDETRGARGSNALYGDVDILVTIGGNDVKTATVTKANDIPEGPLFSFKSEVFEFGLDEDGDLRTVNIISDEQIATSESKPASNRRLSARQQLALDALCEVVLSSGQRPAPSLGLPGSINVVPLERWRDELYSRNILSSDDANPRQEFKRLQEALAMRSRIGRKEGFVWIAA